MTTLIDVTPDLPPAQGLSPVRDLSAAEVSTLAEELLAYHQHFAPFFQRREQREWAALYLRGLLTADVPRKNVEAMALRLLGAGPRAQRQVRAVQQFVGEGGWDDEAILAEHQRLVQETLGDEEGVFIIDGSEFPKHGSHSVGVAPQWCGHTGKKENCQAGVFLGYASRKGATLLDRRLYLPESWFEEDHQPLWRACRIPKTIAFQTKHDLAAGVVEKVIASGRITAKSGGVRRGLWRLACFSGTPGRDRAVVPGGSPAGYAGLAAARSRWTDATTAPKQLGAAPDPLTQRTGSPPRATASLQPEQSPAGGSGQAVARFRLAAVSTARGAQRPAGRRFPPAPRRAAARSPARPRAVGRDPAQGQWPARGARMEVLPE
jgi:hypothetical protein